MKSMREEKIKSIKRKKYPILKSTLKMREGRRKKRKRKRENPQKKENHKRSTSVQGRRKTLELQTIKMKKDKKK